MRMKFANDLLTLQSLMREPQPMSAERRRHLEQLRARLPEPIAAHFFRQLATGRLGIARVRNGVCGGCHLRLSRGLASILERTDELMVCESCGAFVMPTESTPTEVLRSPPRRVARAVAPAAL